MRAHMRWSISLCSALRSSPDCAHTFVCCEKRKYLPDTLSRTKAPEPCAGIAEWIAWLPVRKLRWPREPHARDQHRDAWWIEEALNRVDAVLVLFYGYLPWLLPEFAARCVRAFNWCQGDKLSDFTAGLRAPVCR